MLAWPLRIILQHILDLDYWNIVWFYAAAERLALLDLGVDHLDEGVGQNGVGRVRRVNGVKAEQAARVRRGQLCLANLYTLFAGILEQGVNVQDRDFPLLADVLDRLVVVLDAF